MSEGNAGGLVKTVFDGGRKSLETIFRHLTLGLFLIPLWYFSLPSWFSKQPFTGLEWHVLVIYLVLGAVLGNVWYAAHRFTVHTAVDNYAFQTLQSNLKKPYVRTLAEHIFRVNKQDHKSVVEYVGYRSSLIHLLYCSSESVMVFSIASEVGTPINASRGFFILVSLILFIAAAYAHVLLYSVDAALMNLCFPDNTKCNCENNKTELLD